MIARTRPVQSYQICMILMSGDRLLEGPVEWAGSHFPFVPVYGEQLTIDGKRKWFGMVRHAKDATRAYNVARTSIIESIALSPQAKIVAGFENQLMPTYGITDEQINDIVAYIKTLR